MCLVAPLFAQQPAGRQVIADAIEAANWQIRLDLGRDQMRSGQRRVEDFERQERETNAALRQLRAKWSGTIHRWTFESDFKHALEDPVYRYAALADYDRRHADGGSWSLPFVDVPSFGSLDDGTKNVIYVFGGLAGFLLFGWILTKSGWKPKERGINLFPEKQEQPDTYGSAEWAEAIAAPPDAMTIFSGVFFGKSSIPGTAHLCPLENHQGGPVFSLPENHAIVIGRTRTGKGTRVIIPTLLRQLTSSCICIDPKGELAAVTARARIDPFPGKNWGHTVHIINPWGELAPHFQKLGLSFATYNPLDLLDRDDPNVVSIAMDLAAAICPRDKAIKDPFWSWAAGSVLMSVLLWITDQPGETKTLARAREIVTDMDFSKEFLPRIAASKAFGGAIRENAGPFVRMAQETLSGVLGNLAQHTAFLSDPQIKAATSTSTFSMFDLMRKPTTVYLVIPPYKMDVQRTWLRLLISAGMQTYKHHAGKRGNRCLFLIDEFPALGRLDEVPRDIATMAGYGVDFLLAIQGIDQLKEVYGDAATTILNNSAYKWFCNVNDLHSAEYLSKTLGTKTVSTSSGGSSTSMSPTGGSSSTSTNYGQTGRALLMPDEILNLGRDTAILLAPGSKPQYLRPIDYWKLAEAFTYLQQFYPHMYWEPPLHWDENPLPH